MFRISQLKLYILLFRGHTEIFSGEIAETLTILVASSILHLFALWFSTITFNESPMDIFKILNF